MSKVAITQMPARGAEFSPDYTYIKRDLRRIGILAGSFFAILVVLAFFVR
jgi:hypothetical protein